MSQHSAAPAAPTTPSERFVALLPTIQRIIQYQLRCVPRRDREELLSAAVAAAFVMFVQLMERDRQDRIFATPLARYGVRHALDGREVGTPTNSRDVTSRSCQRKHGVRLQSLHRRDRISGDWRELVVEDRQASPADVAISRLDLAAWLESLAPRQRQLAEFLATGESTQSAARQFHVSAGRISQIRRELEASWQAFQQPADSTVTQTSRSERRDQDAHSHYGRDRQEAGPARLFLEAGQRADRGGSGRGAAAAT